MAQALLNTNVSFLCHQKSTGPETEQTHVLHALLEQRPKQSTFEVHPGAGAMSPSQGSWLQSPPVPSLSLDTECLCAGIPPVLLAMGL